MTDSNSPGLLFLFEALKPFGEVTNCCTTLGKICVVGLSVKGLPKALKIWWEFETKFLQLDVWKCPKRYVGTWGEL